MMCDISLSKTWTKERLSHSLEEERSKAQGRVVDPEMLNKGELQQQQHTNKDSGSRLLEIKMQVEILNQEQEHQT